MWYSCSFFRNNDINNNDIVAYHINCELKKMSLKTQNYKCAY